MSLVNDWVCPVGIGSVKCVISEFVQPLISRETTTFIDGFEEVLLG